MRMLYNTRRGRRRRGRRRRRGKRGKEEKRSKEKGKEKEKGKGREKRRSARLPLRVFQEICPHLMRLLPAGKLRRE